MKSLRSPRIVVASVALMLWCLSPASADLVGLSVEALDDPAAVDAGLQAFDLFVDFDSPGDRLLGVVSANLTASTGAFFQHPSGQDTAPTASAIVGDPVAAFDSFVTIRTAADDGTDETWLTPDFNSVAFDSGVLSGDWFNSNPQNAQGTPDADLRVRIARLTLQDAPPGASVSGSLSVGWQHGTPGPLTVSHNEIEFGCASPAAKPALQLERIGGETRISWTALPLVSAYDVIRGDLDSLRASGGDFALSTVECLANNESGTVVVDQGSTPAGGGSWFLARAVSCGSGTYDADGPAQSEPRDAEAAASVGACP